MGAPMDHDAAAALCADRGMTLAMPKTADLMNAMKRQINTTTSRADDIAWIGLTGSLTHGFFWEDGAYLNISSDYTNWWPRGSPSRRWKSNAGRRECVVVITSNWRWNDQRCEYPYLRPAVICQANTVTHHHTIPPPPPPTATTPKTAATRWTRVSTSTSTPKTTTTTTEASSNLSIDLTIDGQKVKKSNVFGVFGLFLMFSPESAESNKKMLSHLTAN